MALIVWVVLTFWTFKRIYLKSLESLESHGRVEYYNKEQFDKKKS